MGGGIQGIQRYGYARFEISYAHLTSYFKLFQSGIRLKSGGGNTKNEISSLRFSIFDKLTSQNMQFSNCLS